MRPEFHVVFLQKEKAFQKTSNAFDLMQLDLHRIAFFKRHLTNMGLSLSRLIKVYL